MPIYEFHCAACGAEFERIQSFSDDSTPACPSCESRQVTRRMGRPAIHFKGSGWYITDSKKSSGESKSSNGSSRTTEKSDDQASSEKAATGAPGGLPATKNDAAGTSSEKKADPIKTSTASTSTAPTE